MKKIFLIILTLLFVLLVYLANTDSPKKVKKLKFKESPSIGRVVKSTTNKKYIAKTKKLKKYFEKRHKVNGFSGNVLFAIDGNIVYENAFGYSDRKKKKENKLDTKFQVASVTKPFTTYAIMLLKQEGELSYQDSIQKFFPDFPYKGITIKMLMIHKSGLPEYFYFAEKLWEDRNIPITNKDVINLLINKKPQRYYLPNKKYNYINTNYCLLAAIIEEVSGITYEKFMQENIFEPLKMTNTFVYNKANPVEQKNKAIGYVKRRRVAEDTYLNGVVGDKGIYTTVEDMLKFDQAMYNGYPVEQEILEEAFKPAHKRLYIHDNYGFGWRINASDKENKIVYHTGWWKGFRSYFIRQLGAKKTIIILSNMSNQSVFGTRELIKLFN